MRVCALSAVMCKCSTLALSSARSERIATYAPNAPAAAAPVINITNSNQQSQAAGGKTVIIKEKETAAQPAAQPKPKKKEGDEFKEEAPKW